MSRQEFLKQYAIVKLKSSLNCANVSDALYEEIVQDIVAVEECGKPFIRRHYARVRNYRVVCYGAANKLVRKQSGLEVVKESDIFDVINDTHVSNGHCGRDKTLQQLKRKYSNITRAQVEMYISTCKNCEAKKVRPRSGLVSKPIVTDDINCRAQVDLIDWHSEKAGDYAYILNYQDHLTKFVVLRAMKTKRAEEVAHHLIDIFCTFGAPNILQCDNGREFRNRVVEECLAMWPDLKIVHGRPRHSQSQGSVERANRSVQEKLHCWLRDNKGSSWTDGLRFVQWMMNTQVNQGIGRCPFEATFGCRPHLGLKDSRLPKPVLQVLQTQEDLEEALGLSGSAPHDSHDADSCDPAEDSAEWPGGETGADVAGTSSDHRSAVNTAGPSKLTCIVCSEDLEQQSHCSACSAPVHRQPACSSDGPDGARCVLCKRQQTAAEERQAAQRCQGQQAERMLGRAGDACKELSVGTNVRIGIPDVDRARNQQRNVVGVVMERTEEGYMIGTEHGRLSGRFSANVLGACRGTFLTCSEVPDCEPRSLREVARLLSGGSGQGMFKCLCLKSCTGRCKCKKQNRKCISKCHKGRHCDNK